MDSGGIKIEKFLSHGCEPKEHERQNLKLSSFNFSFCLMGADQPHSFVNFASFCCVVAVTFFLGWLGSGRDIVGNYKMIHDRYQVRKSLCCSLSIYLM